MNRQKNPWIISLLVLVFALAMSALVFADGTKWRSGNDAAPLPPLTGQEQTGDKERFDTYVVSVDWLKANYSKVVVLDARTKDNYAKGHLPGAVQAHWQDWSNVAVAQGSEGWAVIDSPKVLAKKFGALGIDGSKPVVIYSDSLAGWGDEGRSLWTFRVFGLTKTFILNGGIKAWSSAGGEITTKVPDIKPVTGPKPSYNKDLIVTTSYVAKHLKTLNILDVREDEEWAGTKVYGEKKKGRIPGSKHIWFKDFYNADGTLQSPAQIRARVESLGFKPQDEVVTYCTGGIRSGFAAIILRSAGYSKARNYNASFSEWVGTGQQIDDKVLK